MSPIVGRDTPPFLSHRIGEHPRPVLLVLLSYPSPLTLPLRIRVFVEVVVTERILFYCQHGLGIGRLVRSAEIVREMSGDSRVLLICGGEKPEGFQYPEHKNVEVLQLPALKTNPDFSNLHACTSAQSMDEIKTLRRTMLCEAFARFKPDAIVTE